MLNQDGRPVKRMWDGQDLEERTDLVVIPIITCKENLEVVHQALIEQEELQAFLQANPRGILDFLRRKRPTRVKTFESESSFVEYAKDMTAFVPPSFSPQ